MYYYSRKSRERILHTETCFHISHSLIDGIGAFDFSRDTNEEKWRFCRHCSPLRQKYREEYGEILKSSAKLGLSVHLGPRCLRITSPRSQWLLMPDGRARLVLYHKNEFKKAEDCLSAVPGYHLQGDADVGGIVDYLEYIIRHDRFRMSHPLQAPQKKREKAPPKKGTKRYKSEQKKQKKAERKQAIRNVMDLIDSLHAHPAV